jgi:DNA-binding transcriptional regulator LsrR (DeoR family)
MRHIREVLRLHYSVGMSQRAVARSLNLAQGTVSKYLNRTRRAGLTWPLPPELDDDVRLENRLYPPLRLNSAGIARASTLTCVMFLFPLA